VFRSSCHAITRLAFATIACACAESSAPARDPYACPVSLGEWTQLGCARVEMILIRPDGTPAVGVYLSGRVIPSPAIFPSVNALPTDGAGRTRIQLDWEVPPLPSVSTMQVVAIRLEPAQDRVHFLDTLAVTARNSLAGERPRTDTITWQLKRW
jgi:hypothetical protein